MSHRRKKQRLNESDWRMQLDRQLEMQLADWTTRSGAAPSAHLRQLCRRRTGRVRLQYAFSTPAPASGHVAVWLLPSRRLAGGQTRRCLWKLHSQCARVHLRMCSATGSPLCINLLADQSERLIRRRDCHSGAIARVLGQQYRRASPAGAAVRAHRSAARALAAAQVDSVRVLVCHTPGRACESTET